MKDVITAAKVIAERYMIGLKVDEIKEVMVSAMIEYADTRDKKKVKTPGVNLGNAMVCEHGEEFIKTKDGKLIKLNKQHNDNRI